MKVYDKMDFISPPHFNGPRVDFVDVHTSAQWLGSYIGCIFVGYGVSR